MRTKKMMILLFTFVLALSTFSLPIVEASNQPDVEVKTDQKDVVENEASQDKDTIKDETRNEVDGSEQIEEQTGEVEEEVDNASDKETKVPEETEKDSSNSEESKQLEELDSVESTEKVEDKEVTEKKTFSVQKTTKSAFPLQKGDRNNTVKEVKEMLNAIDFGGIKTTTYYGNFTVKRVKQFQAYVGLSQTGEVDKTTYNKIKAIYNSPLQKGKRHKSLPNLKKKLNWLDYGKITVTNYYGDFTEKQVKNFQNDNDLPKSGIIDEKTENKINQVFTDTFQQGSRHDSIIDLKKMLNSTGFGNIKVTTYYGSFTAKKVKEFQAYYGLNATGKADLATLDKLDEVSDTPFQKGKRHKDTKELKRKLNKIGFGKIQVTTLYGSFTEKRVKDFQRYYGLNVTGVADSRTRNKIDEIYNSPLQQGKRHKSLPNLKKKLNWLGYGKITVTNYYGNFTEKQVKKFQEDHDLPKSGIIDEKTKDKINQVFTDTFQQGSRHDNIKDIKRKLNSIGFGNIKVTTLYGSFTAKKVKEFQAYYGLKATGKADLATLDKLDEVSDTPFQKGKRHKDTKDLKRKLNKIGFGKIQVTTLYGSYTEKRVKDFQRYYGLKVTGIADSRTIAKIDEVYNSPFQKGKRHNDTKELKLKLNKIGFGKIQVTTLYGSYTEKRVKDFQRYYGLKVTGTADSRTRAKIDEIYNSPLQKGKRHNSLPSLKEKLNWLGYGKITVTNYYGAFTEKQVKKFQNDYDLPKSGIIDEKTEQKIDQVFSTGFQKGSRHDGIIDMKEKLNQIGFGNIKVTSYYGDFTVKKVKDFQRYYGLTVTGKADVKTLEKINEVASSPFQKGKRHNKTKTLKRNLNKLGFGNIQVTTLYGSYTEKRVKDFQRHYGLIVNGIADSRTFAKIDDILNSPFQKGKRHADTIKLKEKLNSIGYGHIKVTSYYGSYTEKKVRQFQKDNNLPVSGIVDEITMKTLMQMKETKKITYSTYPVTLEEALNKQMSQLQQTDKYRNNPAYVSAKYVKISNGATISASSVFLRSTPDFKNDPVASAFKGESVEIIETIKGAEYDGSTTWYKIKYKGMTLYVHSSLVNANGKTATTTANVNVQAEARSSSHSYGQLSKGSSVSIIEEGKSWHQIEYSTWRNPTRSDVKNYLNPNNHDEFQHLVLSSSAEVPASQLNKVLQGKGALEGLGQAFIDGGKEHAVNEIYLISHTLLETGHGKSTLAKGVEVGKNKNGNPVMVTSSNKNKLTNIKMVYNMFGIGAVDSNPLEGGAVRAYNEGWFTPKKAIIGGAKFIGSSYIHNQYKQNTLYKMRWNPANPGYPQYATDIGWAVKQVSQIKQMYDKLDNPTLHFDIVKYK